MNPLAMSVRSAHRRVQGWKVPLGPLFTRGWAEVRIAPHWGHFLRWPGFWQLGSVVPVAPPVFLESAAAPGRALMPRGSRHETLFWKSPGYSSVAVTYFTPPPPRSLHLHTLILRLDCQTAAGWKPETVSHPGRAGTCV